MEFVQITPLNDQQFYDYVEGREIEFFFYLMDYQQYPEHTKLFMAYDAQSQVQGLFIIWRGKTIQLRGTPEAAEAFIEYMHDQGIAIENITGTVAHKAILTRHFGDFQLQFHLYRMTLHQGQERLCPTLPYTLLDTQYRPQIAAFLRDADPRHWGKFSANDIIMDLNRPFLAIIDEGQIASLAGLWAGEQMGVVNTIATSPRYRNRGYATSMVSAAIKYLFQRSPHIIIHVRVKNVPAVKIYRAAGFIPEHEYIVCQKAA